MPSVAVLPFANLSADPDNEYFTDGLTEELIGALANVEGLRIPARTSVYALRETNLDIQEIGRRLGVDNILEGSVRKAGDQLRISAQLIKVSDGFNLWSETYDRQFEDVFGIQGEIADNIVEAPSPNPYGFRFGAGDVLQGDRNRFRLRAGVGGSGRHLH